MKSNGRCVMEPARPFWIVVPSTSRRYGYSHKDINRVATYALGPDFTCRWYRRKRDAQKAADEFNQSESGREDRYSKRPGR